MYNEHLNVMAQYNVIKWFTYIGLNILHYTIISQPIMNWAQENDSIITHIHGGIVSIGAPQFSK